MSNTLFTDSWDGNVEAHTEKQGHQTVHTGSPSQGATKGSPVLEPQTTRSPAVISPARSHHGRSHPWQGHVEEIWRPRLIRTQGTPWICSSIYFKTKICLLFIILCLSPTLLSLTGGYSRPPFSGKNQPRALVNKSPGHDRSVSIQTPLIAF